MRSTSIDLTNTTQFKIKDLLLLHNALLQELRNRNILRTTNNPTGDYAEWLAKERLNLKLATPSAKGYDAIDANEKKYQIKGRHLTAVNQSMQLGTLRNLDQFQFDYLIAIIFEEDWSVKFAAKISHSKVMQIATPKSNINGHIMHFHPNILNYDGVDDITEQLI